MLESPPHPLQFVARPRCPLPASGARAQSQPPCGRPLTMTKRGLGFRQRRGIAAAVFGLAPARLLGIAAFVMAVPPVMHLRRRAADCAARPHKLERDKAPPGV